MLVLSPSLSGGLVKLSKTGQTSENFLSPHFFVNFAQTKINMERTIYFRVSTENQSYERQMFRMTEYFKRMGMSMEGVNIISEKITSHTTFRQRKLYPILKNAKEGDIIYVCQLDRLGRTMVDILELVDFAVKKGIILLTIDNGYQLENKTAMGKLYLGMVSAMAEAERELRAERCQAGVDSATAELKLKGARVTRRGTIQTHWGNKKGVDLTPAVMASARVRTDEAIKWRESSIAVKTARRKKAEGWTLSQIVNELHQLYDDNKPSDPNTPNPYGTVTGKKPPKGTVSKWLRELNPLTLT